MTPYIQALLREREHYQRRNLPERVEQVTASLKALGYQDAPETTAAPAAPETTSPPKPRSRNGK